MFIKNPDSISVNKVIWVTYENKKLLENLGFIALSEKNNYWAFPKTPEVLSLIQNIKGGIDE